jgi:hypothetical protein
VRDPRSDWAAIVGRRFKNQKPQELRRNGIKAIMTRINRFTSQELKVFLTWTGWATIEDVMWDES